MEEFNPEKQLEIIALSQEIFKDSKPLENETYELLLECLYEQSKDKPTIKGML